MRVDGKFVHRVELRGKGKDTEILLWGLAGRGTRYVIKRIQSPGATKREALAQVIETLAPPQDVS